MSVTIQKVPNKVRVDAVDAGEVVIFNEQAWIITEGHGVGRHEDLVYAVNLDNLNSALLEPFDLVQLAYFIKKELVVAPKGI